MEVNYQAVEKAKQLIDEGMYRINIPWRDVQPSENAGQKYLDQNGLDAYGQWFLAIDPNVSETSPERYLFPYGDFKAVQRTGIIAAKQNAVQSQDADLEAAADEILDLFDRLNAC